MTYSIVARDAETGQLGVAVQSHYFSVGAVVPWAEAGVGAVATQSMVEVSYGPLGLELMRAGKSPEDALRALVAADRGETLRQVGMVDARGRAAAHTGARCIAHAGHRTSENVSVQANMMERDTVPDAMLASYGASSGDLAERLLAALDAAEAEGGDIRGRQSSSILVVAGTASGRPWADRLVDLRVEDHPEPLHELRRLVQLQRAYRRADLAEERAAEGEVDTASRHIAESLRLAPGNAELVFWAAIAAAAEGRLEEARSLLARAVATEPRWRELARRLPATGLYRLSDESIEALLAD